MKDNLVEGLSPELVDRIGEFTHMSSDELRLSSEERIDMFHLEALEVGIAGGLTKEQVQEDHLVFEIQAQIWKEKAEAWRRIALECLQEE